MVAGLHEDRSRSQYTILANDLGNTSMPRVAGEHISPRLIHQGEQISPGAWLGICVRGNRKSGGTHISATPPPQFIFFYFLLQIRRSLRLSVCAFYIRVEALYTLKHYPAESVTSDFFIADPTDDRYRDLAGQDWSVSCPCWYKWN